MLVCQGLIMLGLWLIPGTDPSRSLGAVAVFAVLVGFSSATQDIAIDAWRIEAADMATTGRHGGRVSRGATGCAMIVAGAAPLLLAEAYGWNFSYAVDGGADGSGRRGRAGGAARRAPRRACRFTPKTFHPAPALEALEWIARLAIIVDGRACCWARAWPPTPACSPAC